MKVVRVRWHDSVSYTGWRTQSVIDDWFKNGIDVMESVGYLYKKSKKCLIIVQSVHAYDEDTNLSEALRIPMGCVISIKRFMK